MNSMEHLTKRRKKKKEHRKPSLGKRGTRLKRQITIVCILYKSMRGFRSIRKSKTYKNSRS